MLQPWPEFNPERIDEAAEGDIEWVKAFMLGIRQIRGEMNISMASVSTSCWATPRPRTSAVWPTTSRC